MLKENKQRRKRHYSAINSSSEDEEAPEKPILSSYEQAKAKVSEYIAETKQSFDVSPLEYWKKNSTYKPELAKVCVSYLSHKCILCDHLQLI